MTNLLGRLVTSTLVSLIFAQAATAGAQSLERRILAGPDGDVQFTFASRPGVCGDGATFVEDGMGGETRVYENGNFSGRMSWRGGEPCVHGPVRVVVWVTDGEIINLRTYAGPLPPTAQTTGTRRNLGDVPVSDAVGFLVGVATRSNGRASEKALFPIVLADSISPWPPLLRLARDERGGRAVRRTAAFWLARGAAFTLGVIDADQNDDDDVRSSAVFALSQQPRAEAIPHLIEIARTSKHPPVRAQALFWLGQSGDARGIDLFAEILKLR